MDRKATTSFLLAGWYVGLLLPTLAFKYLYLAALSGGGSTRLSLLAASGNRVPLWWVHLHDVVPADFLDVVWLVAGLWLVGRSLLRIPLATLACASVFMMLLVGGAHAIAIREIGAPLTFDNLLLTKAWIADHPDLIRQFLTPRHRAWLVAGLVWATIPVLFTAGCRRLHARQPGTSRAVSVAMVFVLTYSLVFGASAAFSSNRAAIRRGFWTSIVLSALSNAGTNPPDAAIGNQSELLARYERIAFPHGRANAAPIIDVPAEARIPRHVVIFSLETAPLKYYPLADSPELPAFHTMSSHAMVSTEHYAGAPLTTLAIYSMLTGTYPPPGSPLIRAGFKTDGLPDVLSAHGYETSYIESYDLQWNGPHDERVLRDLGFLTIRDAIELAGRRQTEWDTYRIALETRSFDAALEQVVGAARRGRKAFVCVETNLGHHDWLQLPHGGAASGADRIAYTVKILDTLFDRFLKGLATNGLADDVLVVVTGDHGLRIKMEFESMSEDVRYGDLMFNVPFLAYAPSLFPSQVRLPFATSHVDIAPTVLDLLGVPREGRLYLGSNMLDRRLADRMVFLPSASFTGLYPADGFRWKDQVYSLHRIVDRVTVHDAHSSQLVSLDDRPDGPFSEADVRRIVVDARSLFKDTAAYFVQRVKQAPAAQATRE